MEGDSGDYVNEIQKIEWQRKQEELKTKIILEDVNQWQKNFNENDTESLKFIGGVDLSFIKGDDVTACACLVVLSYPALEVVYSNCELVELTAPYIPGFLAFREVEFLVNEVNKLKAVNPEYLPDVIFVDGNGLLHPREFGLACHLGVLVDIPCVGIGKTLFQVDGLEKNDEHQSQIKALAENDDTFPLIGISGKVLGMALKSCSSTSNPIYVSIGHKISLETAVRLVKICCKHRIPEPVRQADMKSREFLRIHFNLDGSQNKKQKPPKIKQKNTTDNPAPLCSYLDDDDDDFTFGDIWDVTTSDVS